MLPRQRGGCRAHAARVAGCPRIARLPEEREIAEHVLIDLGSRRRRSLGKRSGAAAARERRRRRTAEEAAGDHDQDDRRQARAGDVHGKNWVPRACDARQLDRSWSGSDHACVPAIADSWRERIDAVRHEVAGHARRVGRDPGDVAIVAVTKTLPPEAVAAAFRSGLTDVGENYVQEARDKRAHVPEAVRWHLIGTLQRNKARLAARVFDRVHSLDTFAAAEALAEERAALGRPLPVLLQVNTAPER